MIVVKAELQVYGIKDHPRNKQLCELHIINNGTGTATRGNYNLELFSAGKRPRLIKRAYINNWPRKSEPAWNLIASAFRTITLDEPSIQEKDSK